MKRWIWGGLVLFFVTFSLVPNIYELSRRQDLHADRYFELVHNFYTDYNFYLSRIRQGREGAWTVLEKYTSEPHEGSYIQIMYLLMGKVGAWVGVPWQSSGDTYHVGRVVLSFTLLFLISYAVKTAFNSLKWQIIAFLLAVTSASYPILVYHASEWRFGGYMPWWTIMDSLIRITFVPHMLAGQALIIFLILALTSLETMKRQGNWIFLGCLALLLGVIFPPGLMFVGVTYLIFGIVQWHTARNIGAAVVGLMSTPSLLYLALATRVYPWKRLVDYGVLHPQPFNLQDYLLAMGIILPLGVIGAVWVIWKKEVRLYPFITWVVAWFLLIILFQYIPQESPLRFTEMLPHLPLAILATHVFMELYFKLKRYGKYTLIIPMLLVTLGLGQMYSYWRWQKEFLDQKIAATQPLVPTGSYVMYPLQDFVGTIIWIQDHTSRDSVILSETTAGNYIPVYSGNTVYVGHAGTVNTEQKEQIVRAFFSGQMGPARAKEFLNENNIHYIFFGPQEQSDGGLKDLSDAYPFVKEIYRLGLFRIYSW